VVSTVAIAASTGVPSGSTTWALSVAKLTVAETPGIRLSFFSTRAAHEAQVMPPIRRSTAWTAWPSVSLLTACSALFAAEIWVSTSMQ
jgi:hypothetical protein